MKYRLSICEINNKLFAKFIVMNSLKLMLLKKRSTRNYDKKIFNFVQLSK